MIHISVVTAAALHGSAPQMSPVPPRRTFCGREGGRGRGQTGEGGGCVWQRLQWFSQRPGFSRGGRGSFRSFFLLGVFAWLEKSGRRRILEGKMRLGLCRSGGTRFVSIFGDLDSSIRSSNRDRVVQSGRPKLIDTTWDQRSGGAGTSIMVSAFIELIEYMPHPCSRLLACIIFPGTDSIRRWSNQSPGSGADLGHSAWQHVLWNVRCRHTRRGPSSPGPHDLAELALHTGRRHDDSTGNGIPSTVRPLEDTSWLGVDHTRKATIVQDDGQATYTLTKKTHGRARSLHQSKKLICHVRKARHAATFAKPSFQTAVLDRHRSEVAAATCLEGGRSVQDGSLRGAQPVAYSQGQSERRRITHGSSRHDTGRSESALSAFRHPNEGLYSDQAWRVKSRHSLRGRTINGRDLSTQRACDVGNKCARCPRGRAPNIPGLYLDGATWSATTSWVAEPLRLSRWSGVEIGDRRLLAAEIETRVTARTGGQNRQHKTWDETRA
nr:hypothetical protein CFP56_07822 [Quercus suber]